MSEVRVSGRYAKSLIDLAIECKVLDVVYADMLTIKATAAAVPSMESMFKSPIIKSEKKDAILKQIFDGKLNAITSSFITLVVNKKREFFLLDIVAAFIDQYNEINKITTAHIKTASAISEGVQAEVKAFLEKQTGKHVILNNSIDPSLIGGLVIQIEDRLYDASISGKLKKAKQELLNTYISK